ncbi:hypothetical protein EDB92DRAFT_1153677 [Lactarius akahatsu]|uniref:Fungal STAND N-terminal Goodbye domain-containing protein n=1 Tax=Lactarius akahatsu TaxID=416441 RepID=A0AAD4Q8Q2_9AGAM|nr:hypothetical protein EDB92DRAFT_1153677 [Lactarius akahatsu]
MPSISFQPILDAALADYSKQVGIDLDTHPLADSFRSCASPDDVLKLLENKANQFKDFRDGNRKLLNWLSPIVQVVCTLSGVLGSIRTSESDLCWSRCSHRNSQWRQLELRCTRRIVRMPRKFPQTPSNTHRSPLHSFNERDQRKDNGRITFRACSRYQTD